MGSVLVVEDEEDIKDLLVAELEDRGFQVREAKNGVIALQRVSEEMPDVIFVDVMMPVMDGFVLISKLRENPETGGIPVVLVTAMNAHDAKAKAGEAGVKYHLTKPWESWALDFVLEQALKTSGPAATKAGRKEAKYQVYPPRATADGGSLDRLKG